MMASRVQYGENGKKWSLKLEKSEGQLEFYNFMKHNTRRSIVGYYYLNIYLLKTVFIL